MCPVLEIKLIAEGEQKEKKIGNNSVKIETVKRKVLIQSRNVKNENKKIPRQAIKKE